MSKIWDALLGLSLLRSVCFRILEKASRAFSFKCWSARVKFPVGSKRVPKQLEQFQVDVVVVVVVVVIVEVVVVVVVVVVRSVY